MSEEGGAGTPAAPRPAPRTLPPRVGPPPRTQDTPPHPCFDPRYRDPSLRLPHLEQPPRLIRPSEHIAIVERQRKEARDASAREAIARESMALVPRQQMALVPSRVGRPPERPQHLVPLVTVLEPARVPAGVHPGIPQGCRMPAPQQRRPEQRALTAPRMPTPRHDQVVGRPVPAPALPPGLFGAAPRIVVVHRDPRHGFGFTLRHLVVYPPESLNELYDDGRHLAVGVLGAPMDTIFVRSVRGGGPAAAAGLRAGDRVVAVNDEPVLCGGGGRQRAPYARVVQLAQRERVLRLTVVPREHDLLQRYFSEAAYNPETNQRPRVEMPAPMIAEHESRLFDAYRRARPAGQVPPRDVDEAPEYASVASLGSGRYEPRRESDTSIPSAADSKDSLGSFDSNSTVTGRELDDSIILSRIRKSLEQKEAFLRRPSQPTGWVTPDPPVIKQKEFYARPQKMPKTSWPPAASPPPPEDINSVDSGAYSTNGELNGDVRPRSRAFVSTLTKIHETNSTGDSMGSVSNGSSVADDTSMANSNPDNSKHPAADLQLVTTRARQFESSATLDGRTALYRSELARLSTTHPEPTVALRRKEFETRSARRDTKSLDTERTEKEASAALSASLSGNQLMITGSKYVHCPPPEGYVPEVENKVQMRARSNSTGSEGFRRQASDGGGNKRRYGLNKEQIEAMNSSSVTEESETERKSLDERLVTMRPQRPTQLSLAPPDMTSSLPAATTPASPSPTTPADSGFADDSITRRQKKDAQMGEEERAMRRVSYLKATWGDRLHGDSDAELSDPDQHPQFRTTEKKDEEAPQQAMEEGERGVDMQGIVQVKMVVCNGKRASDRSWKQVRAVLQGSKLHLYRNHPSQSPATVGSGAGATDAQGSRDTLDVRYSMAVLADDYTKRKHVLRLTTAGGAELLIQADNAAESARWLRNLKRHSAAAAGAEADQTVPHAPEPQGLSPLPPHRSKKIGRNRSPTGPTTPTLPSSPKTKTWKGRMAGQLRRMKGGGGHQAPQPPAAAGWLGAPLERCPTDPNRPGVPLAVTLCAAAVEATGLKTVGIYRVPGNVAGITALAADLDRGEPPPPEDPKWADVHVASSLLKNYLRKLPDSLLTTELYPAFIAAERAEPHERARQIRRLVRALPDAHYETLKFLMEHLRRVVAHSDFNKMEARNLAIVFGPTLVRGAGDDMLALVNDMSSQCRIIESLVNHYEWYFDEEESGSPVAPPGDEELAPSTGNRQLLLHNVKKIEGKDVTPRDIMSSIISAANRKMQRKPRKTSQPSAEPKGKWGTEREKSPPEKSPPHHLTTTLASYDGLEGAESRRTYGAVNRSTQERIKKFEEETIAMLQRRGDPARAAAADLVSKELQALAGKHINAFTIDGSGDLVSSLTTTFDQKLRTLNNSSPLDDANIPYADEDDAKTTASELSRTSSVERVSPSARTHELKTAWLRGDRRLSSSSSTEDDNRSADSSVRQSSPETEKKEVETSSEDDKSSETKSSPVQTRAALRPANPECAKRNSDASDADEKRNSSNKENGEPKRSESLNRSPERTVVRVLRSESLNCRDARLQRSESFKKENGRRQLGGKLKRKNGMPERGIKRRHTVGGTKDFDKDGWSSRHTRTSSPDLTHVHLLLAPLVPPPRPPLESHV